MPVAPDPYSILEELNQQGYVFENITKEAAQGDAFAYYGDKSSHGTCFKIADHILAVYGPARVRQLAIGIGGDFNHTAVLIDGQYYVDASMPMIVHDVIRDRSYTQVGRSIMEAHGTQDQIFHIYRDIHGMKKGPFVYEPYGQRSDDRVLYEMYKYQWVWDSERITNRIICCKTLKDGDLHEVKMNRYTIYPGDPNIPARTLELNEMQTHDILLSLGVNLGDNENYLAFKRLYARQDALPAKIKSFITKTFI